ncbi:MAG: acetyl-CoA carboxylase carboxyltransferase subunit beta [Planctomycetes bacterium]|nr:acetyl-CoA carboxylase carboxyltransferase subunit beta [Planctomycetota bacterium]
MAWKRFRKKKDMPGGLWIKCPNCDAMLFNKELARNLHVCTDCQHHFPISARQRVAMTVDEGSFHEESPDLWAIDRLNFVDKESYAAKLEKSMKKSGSSEAAIYGCCTIEGQPLVLCVLDFSFIGGSMGCVVGEKVTRAVELATEKNLPVVVISASGGARMHEGALSLMQMAKTSVAIARHAEKGGLYISVLTNPTTGGVMASFAALGDVVVAEPAALIGFAGPRVIQETLRQQLPEGFQRSEFLLDHGFLDKIIPRGEMRRSLANFLRYFWRYKETEVLAADGWQAPNFPGDDEEETKAEAEKGEEETKAEAKS